MATEQSPATEQSRKSRVGAVVVVCAVALAGYYYLGGKDRWPFGAPAPQGQEAPASAPASGPPTLELTTKQLQAVRIGAIQMRQFHIVKQAVGNVDFNQDQSAQVSTPYQGRILKVFVELGERVTREQPLYSIESPDLMTAESTLIQAAGVLDLTNANLTRLRGATKIGGTAQKDLDQAISEQKTAEGAYRAARLALTVFGKTEPEIDQVAKERKVDPALIIRSPLDGVVSARSAAPGVFAMPGSTPAPITISDDSTMWLNAYVVEDDAMAVHVGDTVAARVSAASPEPFIGRVTHLGGGVDPTVHRLLARAQVANPDHRLRAGMAATFAITVAQPVTSPGIPTTGVVREGDGSYTAWVRKDETHFTQRVLKLGIQQDGFDQILDGLDAGESAIVDGAVFVDNILNAGPSD